MVMLWLQKKCYHVFFIKELQENDHKMVIFLLFLCKIVPLKHDSLEKRSFPMDPKGTTLYLLHTMQQFICIMKNLSSSFQFNKNKHFTVHVTSNARYLIHSHIRACEMGTFFINLFS